MNRSDDATNSGTPPDSWRAPPPDAARTSDAEGTTQVRLPGVGSIVFDRYRLLHVLGRGGMGVVWLAEDTKLSRTVALKFLPDIIGTDLVALHELKEETRRGLELAHPNIVRIYDFVDDEEAAAISMEFVKGKTLADMRAAKPQKVFSVAELAPWVREMCEALDYAHTQCHIVHRDLKPANFMVNHESHVKITDFGIARSMSETLTRISFSEGATSGTMLYMSPQQAMGERPRATDDVYSLGATLYELLTSKPPFFRGDISAQVCTKIPPSIRDRRTELNVVAPDVVPETWESAIAACLEKDPARRPQSAGELAAMLDLGASTEQRLPVATSPSRDASPPSAHTASTQPAVPRHRPLWRRKRWPTLAAALAILGLLVWWRATRPGEWTVQTYPAGAFVTLGDLTQIAPAKFEKVPRGRQQATITLDGYEARRLEFKVAPGQKVNIGVIKLSPLTGNIPLSNREGEAFEIKSVTTSVVPPQPTVGDPPNGCWNLDEIFLHSEYGNFSHNGRQYLLHEVQSLLKERGHYQADLTAATSPALHRSIQTYQTLHQLKPTGLLDSATIQALNLANLPDKADWTHASEKAADESWWTRNISTPFRNLFK
jgi:serine/threonine protein kinase